MSRTRRFLTGVRFGYASQAITTIVGLWLTPFLLRRLGEHDFGVWATITQLLGYLVLLDLGTIALLPRDVAAASGTPDEATRHARIRRVVSRAASVLLVQLPLVAGSVAVLWMVLPARWEASRAVLAPVLALFVLCYPFRIAGAALEGLQEFRLLGRTQLATWSLQTCVVIAFVVAGFGLQSLVWGWAAQQLGATIVFVTLFLRRYRHLVPEQLQTPTRAELRDQLARGAWISLSQVATVLVYGSDVLVMSHILGPAAAVPYLLTAKLVIVLQNQPQLLMHAATPALAQLRASGDRERTFAVVSSLSLGMLLTSGAVVVVVAAVNEGFVEWWVGPARYGGQTLTLALLVVMLLRHWTTTLSYTNFSFGQERAVAITSVSDGLVTVVSTAALVWLMGPLGAALGGLIGVVIVGLPFSLWSVSRTMERPVLDLVQPLTGFLIRLVLLTAAAMLYAAHVRARGPVGIAISALLASMAYAAVMYPFVRRSVLAPYVSTAMAVLARAVGRGSGPA